MVSPDKVLRAKRGSQPFTTRNATNNTQIIIASDLMGNSMASSKRQKSTIKQRTSAGDFIMYDTKVPVKVIRFPNAVNSPKLVQAKNEMRKHSSKGRLNEWPGGTASDSVLDIDAQQAKDLMTFPNSNTQSSMSQHREDVNKSPGNAKAEGIITVDDTNSPQDTKTKILV